MKKITLLLCTLYFCASQTSAQTLTKDAANPRIHLLKDPSKRLEIFSKRKQHLPIGYYLVLNGTDSTIILEKVIVDLSFEDRRSQKYIHNLSIRTGQPREEASGPDVIENPTAHNELPLNYTLKSDECVYIYLPADIQGKSGVFVTKAQVRISSGKYVATTAAVHGQQVTVQ